MHTPPLCHSQRKLACLEKSQYKYIQPLSQQENKLFRQITHQEKITHPENRPPDSTDHLALGTLLQKQESYLQYAQEKDKKIWKEYLSSVEKEFTQQLHTALNILESAARCTLRPARTKEENKHKIKHFNQLMDKVDQELSVHEKNVRKRHDNDQKKLISNITQRSTDIKTHYQKQYMALSHSQKSANHSDNKALTSLTVGYITAEENMESALTDQLGKAIQSLYAQEAREECALLEIIHSIIAHLSQDIGQHIIKKNPYHKHIRDETSRCLLQAGKHILNFKEKMTSSWAHYAQLEKEALCQEHTFYKLHYADLSQASDERVIT